jgi:hypothetical protein
LWLPNLYCECVVLNLGVRESCRKGQENKDDDEDRKNFHDRKIQKQFKTGRFGWQLT